MGHFSKERGKFAEAIFWNNLVIPLKCGGEKVHESSFPDKYVYKSTRDLGAEFQ